MNGLDLERPARVRSVMDILTARPTASREVAALLGADRLSGEIGSILRSHDGPGTSCTQHGSCLHETWDIAAELVDHVAAAAHRRRDECICGAEIEEVPGYFDKSKLRWIHSESRSELCYLNDFEADPEQIGMATPVDAT